MEPFEPRDIKALRKIINKETFFFFIFFFHWHHRTLSNNVFPFFFYLPPTLSIFSLPALEGLFLLSFSIFSWIFPFFSSLTVLE
jgi:hypothetical protein